MAELKTREPSEGLRRRKQKEDDEEVVFLSERIESILTENNYRSIQFIDMGKLVSFKNQKRSFFDQEKLKNLSETIKEHGIRQPLTVIQSENLDVFEIVSGERRFLAAKMIGLDKVPCIIIHNRQSAEEIAVIENVQRTDLHPIELGKAYNSLLSNGVVSSNSELSKKIGVPRTQISEYIAFSNIPEEIAEKLISNGIAPRHILRKISKCSSVKEMDRIVDQLLYKTTNPNPKQTIISFSIENSEIEAKVYENIKLSNEDLQKLCTKLEKTLEEIKHKLFAQ